VSVAPRESANGRTLIRFEVRDSGIGIEPESVKSLFPAIRAGGLFDTRHFGGTGLGLSIRAGSHRA